MKPVNKKNISLILADVKKPELKNRTNSFLTDKKKLPDFNRPVLKKKKHFLKWLTAIFLFLAVFSAIFSVFVVFPDFKSRLIGQSSRIWNNFELAQKAILKFQPETAADIFKNNADELNDLKNKLGFVDFFQNTFPLLKNSVGLIKEINSLNFNALMIAENLANLKLNGLEFLFGEADGRSGELVKILEDLKIRLAAAGENLNSTRNKMNALKNFSAEIGETTKALTSKYIDFNDNIGRVKSFLEGLIDFLKTPDGNHLLLFFQNPSEMRPAGGFIGSYADLTFANGFLTNIDVRDIYDSDGQLDLKIAPPWPLQAITGNWGARDANWFFDYRDSAGKVIEFLEESKIYKEKLVRFQGALSLNVNVIGDLLEIIGPIPLSDYNLIINQNNFLFEVQKEVEAGQDKTKGQPKRILKTLTPIILERLRGLSSESKMKVFERLQERLSKKDIMFYFKDSRLQDFFFDGGFAGDVFKMPENFFGNYLAVINANIAGGKSDAFINQDIELKTVFSGDKALNRLIVKRIHSGQDQKEWWWRAKNQNFIKILLPLKSSIISASGFSRKIIKPPFDYEEAGYRFDPAIKAVEDTFRYSGKLGIYQFKEYEKNGVAGWFNIAAGKTGVLELEYETVLSAELKNGQIYQFVFDKQSGVKGGIKINISAPSGFKWKESNSEFFDYENNNPEARIILDLTLTEK